MPTPVDIANAALTKLGSAHILSMTDGSKAARECNLRFEPLRDYELRIHRWQFAIKRAQLPASATAPLFGWGYSYPLPPDFLRLDMVNDAFPAASIDSYIGTETGDWAIEGNALLTDIAPPLYLRYGGIITDPTAWDAAFREVMACLLAAELAEALTQSSTKKAELYKLYEVTLMQAIRIGAVERPPMPLPDDGWMMSRI